jgi:uncharacterized membrane protein
MSNETLINANPLPSLLSVTHLVYALHALSLLIGITTAATIIGAFVFGVPSIIAVVINYLKRGEASGTFLESHFRWQIRTFWFGMLWSLLGGFFIHDYHWHSAGYCGFHRRRRVGDLPGRSRLVGAARPKTNVYQFLTELRCCRSIALIWEIRLNSEATMNLLPRMVPRGPSGSLTRLANNS